MPRMQPSILLALALAACSAPPSPAPSSPAPPVVVLETTGEDILGIYPIGDGASALVTFESGYARYDARSGAVVWRRDQPPRAAAPMGPASTTPRGKSAWIAGDGALYRIALATGRVDFVIDNADPNRLRAVDDDTVVVCTQTGSQPYGTTLFRVRPDGLSTLSALSSNVICGSFAFSGDAIVAYGLGLSQRFDPATMTGVRA